MGPIVHTIVLRQVIMYLKGELGLFLSDEESIIDAYNANRPDLERQFATRETLIPMLDERYTLLTVHQFNSYAFKKAVYEIAHHITDNLTMGHLTGKKEVEYVFEPMAEIVSRKDGWTEKILQVKNVYDTFDEYAFMLNPNIQYYYSKYLPLTNHPLITVIFNKKKFDNMIREAVRLARELTVELVRIAKMNHV